MLIACLLIFCAYAMPAVLVLGTTALIARGVDRVLNLVF